MPESNLFIIAKKNNGKSFIIYVQYINIVLGTFPTYAHKKIAFEVYDKSIKMN